MIFPQICEQSTLEVVKSREQFTLSQPVFFEGIGIFSGNQIKIAIHPHNQGICFRLGDCMIPAHHSSFIGVHRTTILGNQEVKLSLVEHVLSALYAMEIDHAIIDVEGNELPIGDGSADHFVKILERCVRISLGSETPVYTLKEPLYLEHNGAIITVKPSSELKFTYTMNHNKYKQFSGISHTYTVSPETYPTEIAPARTFCSIEEIQPLIDQGYISGGSTECALVFENGFVKDGQKLKLTNEPIRHKILDCIGDFSLLGVPILADFNIINGGHTSNIACVKSLVEGKE